MRGYDRKRPADAAEELRRLVAECNAGGALPADIRRTQERPFTVEEEEDFDFGLPAECIVLRTNREDKV